jgi:S1-C subfamily serine protease
MKRTHKGLILVILLSFTIFACQATSEVGTHIQSTPYTPTVSAVETALSSTTEIQTAPVSLGVSESEDLLVKLYKDVNLGVVAIQVLTPDGTGLGSGFVIDHEGHIVTNYHVIEGNTELEIDFPSGYKTRGVLVGTDTDSDLAILKVDAPAEEIHPLKLGDSSLLQVGQTVLAIGNPFGLSGTMTTGIISGLGRTLESMRQAPGGDNFTAGDVIQTDTAINPGNSGGPLINLDGEVIGVNRAIRTLNFTTSEEPLNSGVGFAIAVNILKRVAPELIKNGHFDYPYLGISSLPEITLLQLEALNIPNTHGAYITSITPGSPADRAGLRSGTLPTDIAGLLAGGDLITKIDGNPITDFSDLLSYLINFKSPGDKVILTILREGKEQEIELTLDKRP